MAKAIRVCKTCGKKYEACRTPNPTGVFRWRDVACSIECAQKYLAAIEESRSNDNTKA